MATAAFDGNAWGMCSRGESSTDTPPDLSPKTNGQNDPKKEKTEGAGSSAGARAEGSSSADGTPAGTRSDIQQDSESQVVSTPILNGPRPVDHPDDEVFHSDSESDVSSSFGEGLIRTPDDSPPPSDEDQYPRDDHLGQYPFLGKSLILIQKDFFCPQFRNFQLFLFFAFLVKIHIYDPLFFMIF